MTEKGRIDPIRYIFDVGWNCRLTPCYVEWLSKILREGYWKIKPIPFVSEIVEEKKNDDDLRTVYSCGYWKSFHGNDIGFKNGYIKKGYHQNLHQVIHCLNEYRGIPFEKINIEQGFGGYQVDVLGEINPEKYIVVELGHISPYAKLWLIYDPHVKEFWFDGLPFDGKREYFYSLNANGKLPTGKGPGDIMRNYFKEKCSKENLTQFSVCDTYSKELCYCYLL